MRLMFIFDCCVAADGQYRVRDDGHGGGQQIHGAARQVRGRQLEVQVRLRDPRGHALQEDVRHLAGKRSGIVF